MKVISWNLLRLTGAAAEDVANLVAHEKPDVLLMQEATEHMDVLPSLVDGHFHRQPWPGRIHGLAVWTRSRHVMPHALPLPASRLPGRLPRRRAQIIQVGDITFANVHLSHGQLLNRRQLARVAASLRGKPSAIIGDYNAIGPILMPGFFDVGPLEPTHFARNVVPFRLDRCLVHGLRCSSADTLAFGPSDHRPIVLDLHVSEAVAKRDPLRGARHRIARLRAALR
ncbi:MAG: endonuclease/exonuclease/phosphatase family protein [Reyranella sp.]|uniref:endonuclease/exonuclease/phosphatase family protein n=1 Tax=Reyranella sp. TaxID=1929291 RepID=UPI00273190AE|nr:endonuclease/exonuclease/phosphatase family protein [Reyranella sp.]MDP1964294.1 endonuclease/exonuclease/phosphatase family protein [Reyranella sp.]MDP2374566.1 endonuclease/exonuclease/phosphatase family protein [Reyranella sp.]